MPRDLQPAADWFDKFWNEHRTDIPVFLRNDAFKETARKLVRVLMEGMGKQATTPEGIRQIVAYARIAAILKGVNGVANAPDPSPEQVADMVERLVQRVKP
jgi:hypothetical protein